MAQLTRITHYLEDMQHLTTNMTTIEIFFAQLKKDMEKIQANWNGEDSGIKEERAGYASDAIEKIDELLSILNELGY